MGKTSQPLDSSRARSPPTASSYNFQLRNFHIQGGSEVEIFEVFSLARAKPAIKHQPFAERDESSSRELWFGDEQAGRAWYN
jgi:hypothetical protein